MDSLFPLCNVQGPELASPAWDTYKRERPSTSCSAFCVVSREARGQDPTQQGGWKTQKNSSKAEKRKKAATKPKAQERQARQKQKPKGAVVLGKAESRRFLFAVCVSAATTGPEAVVRPVRRPASLYKSLMD
jgi:hypothetical protein